MPYQAVLESADMSHARLAPLREALEVRAKRAQAAAAETEHRIRVAASVEYT